MRYDRLYMDYKTDSVNALLRGITLKYSRVGKKHYLYFETPYAMTEAVEFQTYNEMTDAINLLMAYLEIEGRTTYEANNKA